MLDNFLKPKNQLTPEELKEFREVMSAIASGDRDMAKAVATKVVSYMKEEVEQRDLADLILGTDHLELGVTPEYIIKGKSKVYWHEPGSYAPRTQIVNRTFTLTTQMLSAHPEYELGQLKTGRYGSMAEITSEAKDEMIGAINALVWNTLKGAVTSGTNYANMSNVPVTRAALSTAVRYMEDKTGGAVAIIGRRPALNAILDFNIGTSTAPAKGVYDSDTIKQIRLRGFDAIDVFEGVPIIAIPQWLDAYGNKTISETDILITGHNIGKYAVVEDFQSMDGIDIDTLMWHIHIWKRCGLGVFQSDRIYRIANCG